MGESISEGTIASLLKKAGDAVEEDEAIAQIETDKVTIDVRAPSAGRLEEYRVRFLTLLVGLGTSLLGYRKHADLALYDDDNAPDHR